MKLRFKVLVPLMVGGLLLAAYIAFAARPYLLEKQRAEHDAELNTHLDTVALIVAQAWDRRAGSRAAPVLDTVMARNLYWRRLELHDLQQRLLHAVRPVAGDPRAQGWTLLTREVWFEGKPVATLSLWYDAEPLQQELRTDFWTFQAIIWLGGLVLLGVLAGLFELWVHRPLTHLRLATARFARGDETVPLPAVSRDEIGELVGDFAVMRDTLSADQAAMLAAWRSVDRQVRERTLELRNQKDALDLHSIVAVTDPAGRITYVNDKFCEISQYSRDELLGQNHRLLNSGHHPREFFTNMWRTIASGRPWHGDICNRRKDGSRYWVSSTVVPFLNEDGKPYQYVAIRTDITWRKQAETELEHARDAALAASRAKSEFLSVISHEIRTPLNGVIGVLGLMQRWALDARQQRYVEAAERSAQSLLTMLNQMLDFTRLDAERVQLEQIAFNPHEAFQYLGQVYAARAETKGLIFRLHLDPSVPASLTGDPARLQQILTNLLDNAIKFTESGGVSLAVHSRTQPDGSWWLHMEVRDTGVGIADTARARIFDAFTQADSTITRRYGGTGLGLAIVAKLVQLMGGTISLKDESVKGSCFMVELPFAAVADAAADSPSRARTG